MFVSVQFQNATLRERLLIGRHLRGDDGRTLARHLQLHPQVAHRASRAERTAVHRVSGLIHINHHGDGLRLSRQCGTVLCGEFPERTADRLQLALLVEQAQRVLEEREVFHAGGHIVRAPPRHTPQVPAIHGTFNGLAAEFRRVVGFQHILRRTDFLEPHRALGILAERLGQLGQVQCVRRALLTGGAVSLRDAVEHPGVNHCHITLGGGLHRSERVPIDEPGAIVDAVQRVVPFTGGGRKQRVQPCVDLPVRGAHLRGMRPVRQLIDLVAQGQTLERGFLGQLIGHGLDQFTLGRNGVRIGEHVARMPGDQP